MIYYFDKYANIKGTGSAGTVLLCDGYSYKLYSNRYCEIILEVAGDPRTEYYGDGKIYKIGDAKFEYYHDGRIFQIGNAKFEYYNDGRIFQIGNARFEFYNDGRTFKIGDVKFD